MRIEFTKFEMSGVKALLVRKSGDTEMVLESGKKKGTCGKYVEFEGIIEGGYEMKFLESGDVLYRAVA